jgi:hypothetical protein
MAPMALPRLVLDMVAIQCMAVLVAFHPHLPKQIPIYRAATVRASERQQTMSERRIKSIRRLLPVEAAARLKKLVRTWLMLIQIIRKRSKKVSVLQYIAELCTHPLAAYD